MTSGSRERTGRGTRKWKIISRTEAASAFFSTAATEADRRRLSRATTRSQDRRQTTESRTGGRIHWTRCTAATRNTPDTRRSWSVRRSRCTRLRICPNSCVPVTRAAGWKWCSRYSSCTNIASPVDTVAAIINVVGCSRYMVAIYLFYDIY